MGLRRSFDSSLLGVPHGPLGWIGAWLLASMKGKDHCAMAAELDLPATKPKPSSIDEAGKATTPVEEVMA